MKLWEGVKAWKSSWTVLTKHKLNDISLHRSCSPGTQAALNELRFKTRPRTNWPVFEGSLALSPRNRNNITYSTCLQREIVLQLVLLSYAGILPKFRFWKLFSHYPVSITISSKSVTCVMYSIMHCCISRHIFAIICCIRLSQKSFYIQQLISSQWLQLCICNVIKTRFILGLGKFGTIFFGPPWGWAARPAYGP